MAKVNGITVAIKADTSGVTAGLKDLTSDSIKLAQQLKSVDALLKMNPESTELQAEQQKILAQNVETTRQKLESLKAAQDDVTKAYERGDIGTEQYLAFQRELTYTEQRLQSLTSAEADNAAETQEAAAESSKLGETLKNVVSAGADIAAQALSTMVDGVKSLVSLTGDVAAYGDEIDKTSQKMGMSAQAYQEWDAIMQHSGTTISSMTSSMKKLAEAVESPTDKTTEAFEKLGISMEKAASLSQEDLFAETIKGLQKMESGTERTATASALLGKNAMELGALLNTSAEDTEAMRQRVHELGGVMSDDAVKASAAYQDSLQDMQTAISGVSRSVGTSFMPSVTQIMDGIAELVTGNTDAISAIQDGIDAFLNNFSEITEKVLETAEKIIPVLVDGIVKALPKLAESAGRIIFALSKSIVQKLPEMIKAAAKIVEELADGIIKALPELIPAVIDIMLEVVDILTKPDTLGMLVDAAIQIIVALTDGIINSLPVLLERLPEIVDNIVTVLVDNVPKLLTAAYEIIKSLCEYLFNAQNIKNILDTGVNILKKLIEGVLSLLYNVGEAAQKIVSEITDKITSTDWLQVGKDVINGFMQGVFDAWNSWSSWWQGFGEYIYDALHPGGDTQTDWENYIGNAAGGTVGNTRALIGADALTGNGSGGISSTTANNTTTISFGNVIVNGGDKNAANDFIRQVDRQLRDLQTRQNRGIGGVSWATS